MKLNMYLLNFVAIVTLLSASVGNLWAQADVTEIPENAYKKTYGSDWGCSWGFKKTTKCL
jgi:hypothetical protein